MRQAYDYWQDQPGNYYSNREQSQSDRHTRAGALSDGWVFVTRLCDLPLKSDRTRPATAFRAQHVLAVEQASSRSPCFPISQVSDQLSWFIEPKSRPSVRTTSQPAAPVRCAQSRRIPEWLFANRFGHRQAIHILQHCRHESHKDGVRLFEKPSISPIQSRLSHPRASSSCKTGASMARSRECQPSRNGGLLDQAVRPPL